MSRAVRSTFLAFKLSTQGGCGCTQCRATNALMGSGFAAWPKGEAATPREAKSLYLQHAAFNWKDARKRVDLGPAGIGFYGVPVGSRAEAERTLNASFATLEA